MRLSFVVPAYNEEAYLPACLESILSQIDAQTRHLPASTFEIIVVNNASTDRTRDIALSYPGVILVDEPRKGLTFARQAGFAASTGTLIANVDADSRLTPNWVAQVLSTFAEAEAKLAAQSSTPALAASTLAPTPLSSRPERVARSGEIPASRTHATPATHTPTPLSSRPEALSERSEPKGRSGEIPAFRTRTHPHATTHSRKPIKPLAALSGPVLYYDLTPRQRLLVHVFYLTAWTTYAINRYLLRVGSMVQGGNFVTTRSALEAIGGFNTAISFYGEDTDIARRLNAIGEVRFTFDLKMFSSARRLKSEGMLTMAWRYGINYLWTTFLHRPYTDTYIDIRETLPTPQPES